MSFSSKIVGQIIALCNEQLAGKFAEVNVTSSSYDSTNVALLKYATIKVAKPFEMSPGFIEAWESVYRTMDVNTADIDIPIEPEQTTETIKLGFRTFTPNDWARLAIEVLQDGVAYGGTELKPIAARNGFLVSIDKILSEAGASDEPIQEAFLNFMGQLYHDERHSFDSLYEVLSFFHRLNQATSDPVSCLKIATEILPSALNLAAGLEPDQGSMIAKMCLALPIYDVADIYAFFREKKQDPVLFQEQLSALLVTAWEPPKLGLSAPMAALSLGAGAVTPGYDAARGDEASPASGAAASSAPSQDRRQRR